MIRTLGNRASDANASRGSTITHSYPAICAIWTSGCAMWTPPTMIIRSGGLWTQMNQSPAKPDRSRRIISLAASSTSAPPVPSVNRRSHVRTFVMRATASLLARASTSRASISSLNPLLIPAGSTRISICPPQARPTENASSSETPNSTIRGIPSICASKASATTAPSTHPPETDPAILLSDETASWLPAGLGADPQVLVTVANAAPPS